MKTLFILILCIFTCYACKKQNKVKIVQDSDEIVLLDPIKDACVDMQRMDTIQFKLNENKQVIIENFGRTKIIPLEATSQSLIGSIQKIICRKEKIYIHNYASRNSSIMIFDTNGYFQGKIEKSGRGPGEYIKLGDFDVDEQGYVYLSDLMQLNKLLVYNDNLKYDRTINLEAAFLSFGVYNNKIWCYTARSDYKNDYKYLVLVMDQNGKVCHKFFPFEHLAEGTKYTNRTTFTKSDGQLYINLPFTSIIYSVDSLNYIYGKYYLLYDVENSKGRSVNRFEEDVFKSFYPMKDKFIVSLTSESGSLHEYSSFLFGCYDVRGGRSNFSDMWGLKNDFTKEVLTYPWAGVVRGIMGDSIVIHPIEALTCLDIYKRNAENYKQLSKEYREVIDKLGEDDNPILFFNKVD